MKQKNNFFVKKFVRWCVPLYTVGLLLGSVACYQGLAVRRYAVATPKWAKGKALRLAVVADLHSQSFGYRQDKLSNLLQQQAPDIILLAGDIVDERCPETPVWDFLRNAVRIAPVVYAPGNHEYRTGRMGSILCQMERLGVTVLMDALVEWETPAGVLLLAGMEDIEKRVRHPKYAQAMTARRVFASVAQTPAVTLLLVHRPERHKLYRELGFDLAVSGHVHGGCVRIPYLLNGVFGTDQGLFPDRAGGAYREGGLTHVVSRGLAVYPGIPRIFNPPELVVIDLKGTGE